MTRAKVMEQLEQTNEIKIVPKVWENEPDPK